MARGDLTDGQWALIEPHLPLADVGPIPDLRQQFNGAMWRFRTGSPWRDVPERYGNWSALYDAFRSWALKGVFQHLMEVVIAEAAERGEVDLGLVGVDSVTARAHHHAAGMAMEPEQLTALEKAVEAEKGAKVRDESRKKTAPRAKQGPSGDRRGDGAGLG
jgi:transposase